jgi:3-hydroxybutyryl-CoA dehydratase
MHVGHRFERVVRWTPDEIVAFADLAGDSNPLHHDAEYSRGTRFGGLIASGAQTVAYLMSLCASQTTADSPGVGLEFNFTLLGPAKPDDDILLRWEVTAVEESERPAGTIVALRGEAIAGNGKTILKASARTLLVEKL